MSKKIVAGALGTALAVSSFAVLGGMAFAANTEGWHEVDVTVTNELLLGGGNTQVTCSLLPSLTTNSYSTMPGGSTAITDLEGDAVACATVMTVQATAAWTLSWLAVTGNRTTATALCVGSGSSSAPEYSGSACVGQQVPAAGTNLGTTGFTSTGGFAMANAALGAAGSANQWNAEITYTGSGVALSTTAYPTLPSGGGATPAAIVQGAGAGSGSVTPIYGASTSGAGITMGTTYLGTIFYTLSQT